LQIDYRNAIYRIDDLRRETIFAGASLEDDMQLAIDGLRQDEITAELDRYLREQQVPSEKRDDIAENWQARYRFLPTAEFEPGATIKITVGNNGDPDSPPLFTDSITLSADRLMTTLFLELPP
jgi:hypothetical protein